MDSQTRFGGQESFVFNPAYKLQRPLRTLRLRGQEVVEEIVSHKRVRGEALGLELVNDGTTLRLWNPQTGEFLRTPAEESAARQTEATARQTAEQHAPRLAAKLRELGLNLDQL